MNITKTDFIAYLDSPKHLWAIKNNKLKEQEVNVYLEHLFEQGYDVEEHAEKYIQEYLVKEYGVGKDQVLLQPEYEEYGFEARTDVLIFNKETDKWDMYEVKSSTSVTKTHKYDATFQTLVFRSKYELGNVYILHLDKEYIRNGDVELDKLFIATDITEDVEKLKEEVNMLRMGASNIVNVENPDTVTACIRPKTCPCPELCHADTPKYSIYDINHLTASEKKIRKLESMGIKSVYDIPNTFDLSDKQRIQVDVAKSKEVHIDIDAIKEDLHGIEYPIHFIDYETFNSAIPLFDGYKPYDQIPFQWSLHVLNEKGGEFEHFEFLHRSKDDPIPNFIEEMKNHISKFGSIVVWNKGFEGNVNRRMGFIHPEYYDFCEDMNNRLYDLMDIFRDGYYLDPSIKGSYSIKKVLPLFAPDLSYEGMDIGEGATAMAKWKEMVYGGSEEGDKIYNDLLEYCKLDTWAMVEIWRGLKELS